MFIRKTDGWANALSGSHGAGNGYVAVPPKTILHGVDYDDLPSNDIHGGITFAGECGALLDASEIFIEEEPAEDISNWWVFGFDTFHLGDSQENWPLEAVKAETLRLKSFLTKVEKDTALNVYLRNTPERKV
jgi:hypothetical protein